MRIIVFGNSQANLINKGYKYINENPSDFNICSKKNRKELSKHKFEFLGLPGKNFKNIEVTSDGRIILPKYVYSSKTGEIVYENKFQEINSTNWDLIIWAEGPNVMGIYWNLIGYDNPYPTLLSSSLLDLIYDEKEFEYCKVNSNLKVIHVGSPNPFNKDLSLIYRIFTKKGLNFIAQVIWWFKSLSIFSNQPKNFEIHKRNMFLMKSYLDKKNSRISYIWPPNDCLESNHKYTSIKFASKPGKDFIHANEMYGSKILNSIIENLAHINK